MKFNENLKYLRKREGLTQEELAEKLNVSRQSVTKWESGQSLPDIEKVKEIAYMFSVSVDSLIGDIESKTTNKIKKKIDDIGWFVFWFISLAVMVITSLYGFISQTIQDEDTVIGITILMVIAAFVIFTGALQSYLKNNEDRILNMKATKEGKSERTKYITKKYIKSLIHWCILSFIFNIGVLTNGTDEFIMSVLRSIMTGLVLDLIVACGGYIALEKRVKELNKE